jgi:saccharopine dehydrogenase (NAD+, L-lysine-forming)
MPKEILGVDRTAIAWTTATSVAAVVEMVNAGTVSQAGFIKQEEIPFSAFLETENGARYLTEF